MKKLLASLIATLALTANAYAATIVVGTDAGFAPYEFKILKRTKSSALISI